MKYSITCIQRPLKGSNQKGLLQQMVFKCRFYLFDLRRIAVSEQWSLKAGGLLIQVVSNTGLTVPQNSDLFKFQTFPDNKFVGKLGYIYLK